MRKFISNVGINLETFMPQATVKLLNGDAVVDIITNEPVVEIKTPKYTNQDLQIIELVTTRLETLSLPPITDEEIDKMLDPTGMRWGKPAPLNPEDLQALAGFQVEKVIKYHTTQE